MKSTRIKNKKIDRFIAQGAAARRAQRAAPGSIYHRNPHTPGSVEWKFWWVGVSQEDDKDFQNYQDRMKSVAGPTWLRFWRKILSILPWRSSHAHTA